MSATLAAPKPPHPMAVLRVLKTAGRGAAAGGGSIAPGGPGGTAGSNVTIAPAGSPSVSVKTDVTNPGALKIILDFDAAQPAPKPLDATLQPVQLSLAPLTVASLAQTVGWVGTASVTAKIGGVEVPLNYAFSGPTAGWTSIYGGGKWAPKLLYDALDVGGTFSIKKDGANYVMNFEGQTPPASWADCTTREELFYWARMVDTGGSLNWDDLGLKYDRNTGDGDRLDPTITVAAAKAVLQTGALIHFFDANNKAAPAQSGITVTQVKDAAATATDRKAVITVKFPAGLTGWCIYQGKASEQVGSHPDGSQKKPLDGQTEAVFNVTYAADGTFSNGVWVGQTWVNVPGLKFP